MANVPYAVRDGNRDDCGGTRARKNAPGPHESEAGFPMDSYRNGRAAERTRREKVASARREHAARTSGAVRALRAVRRRFLRTAGEHAQQRLDALHARIDQRTVAIVELAAASGTLGTIRPRGLQSPVRVAPGHEVLDAGGISAAAMHATERTTLFFDTQQAADGVLTLVHHV